ncbi:sigma factor-like helix-turn-helix DNA-binding protein [Streptomyces sp. NPDC046862]|uniref:sigma factor-like helix-turn-helix DNA-binding protein n=1 Tax=Streptomyces sp. NPDC046862 TaxID=3154603 RepID=UPI003455BDC3
MSLRRRGNEPVLAFCAPLAQDEPAQQALVLTLPVEYTAFCLLHRERYLRYTRERVQDAWASQKVVEAALGNLATIWPTVISSSRPAAIAWRLLDALIASALRGQGANKNQQLDAVHQTLPRAQADAVILRCRLQLSEAQAAELMGVEKPVVASHLRMAQRALPGRLTDVPAVPGAHRGTGRVRR